MTDPSADNRPVLAYLEKLQERLCAALSEIDGTPFQERRLEDERSRARHRMLEGGVVFERAAVHCTAAQGPQLPEAALRTRPGLAERPFRASSLSVIVHPRNPYVPAAHANLRCFVVSGEEPAWWFGGGLDLTPVYGFEEDAVHWHTQARAACAPFGPELYPRFKQRCDEYFYLPHRQETRGIGGLFFDDWSESSFERCFALVRSIGDAFLPGYLPIVKRRQALAYGERERSFQLYRRGRYVEFNLLLDQGTRYGLQAGRRAEAILASLPPLAAWRWEQQHETGSPEARLVEEFLRPRDWLGVDSGRGP